MLSGPVKLVERVIQANQAWTKAKDWLDPKPNTPKKNACFLN